MTRVYMTGTGETVEGGDLYANRLIEQGLAVYVESDDEDEGYADPGEIVDLEELVEDIRIIQMIIGALAPSRAGDFQTPGNLVMLAGIGQADAVLSVGAEIPMTYTDRSGGTETEYSYPYIVGGIAYATGADGRVYRNSLYMVPKYAGPYVIQYDGAANWIDVNLEEEPRALSGWRYRGKNGNMYVELSLAVGAALPTTYQTLQKIQVTSEGYTMESANPAWRLSCLRQWMNSEAAAGEGWWEAVNYRDPPPIETSAARPGWMNGIPEEWRSAAMKTLIPTPVYSGGEWRMEYTEDTFFPPSLEMLYIVQEQGGSGEDTIEWFVDGEEPHEAGSQEAGREKLMIRSVSNTAGDAVECWTRTWGTYGGMVWTVLPTGKTGGTQYAQNERYPLPCFIIAGEAADVTSSQSPKKDEGDEGEWTDESIHRYYIDELGHLIQEKTKDVGTEGEIVRGRLQITRV